jgi:OPA family sugar phosphate sensor protein UhpC-like MFS transporter
MIKLNYLIPAQVLSALKAQTPQPILSDATDVHSQYRHWRLRTMYAMFIGYAIFYFCRKNLSAAAPALIQDLGYSKLEIGTIWSLLYLTYGFSKMANGVLADQSNPRFFMAIGLILSAVMNLFFGLSSSLLLLGVFWALNGWFQGMGWPPCARLLTHWYSQSERGTKWAIWNTAHQVGGGIILILGGFLTEHYGWRSSFYIPALLAILTAFFLINRLRDTPESLGLPPIEVYRNEPQTEPQKQVIENSDEVLGAKVIFFQYILRNKKLWYLSIANFFVYLVRFGAMDWAPTFLVEVKHSTIGGASLKAAGFEFLGIAGAFLAGWLSDRFFHGRRSMVNLTYMLLLAFVILEFWLIPEGYPYLDALALSAVGFLVYGPQMLVGVAAADLAGKNAAASATGFTGLFGYLGSIASGVGTGWIVDRFGWNGGFLFFIGAALVGAGCFVLTRENTLKT